jgi:cell division protein FtsI (penicillin-binding protein 3)
MSQKNPIVWKVYSIYFIFVVIMAVVLIQTAKIQFEGRTNLFFTASTKDKKLPIKYVNKTPRRGEILDVNSTPLVTTVTYYAIYMDATVVDEKVFDSDLMDLCQGLEAFRGKISAREYFNKIMEARKRGNRYLMLFPKVTNEQRKHLRTLPIFKLGKLKGGLIDTEERQERRLPHGKMLRRTLGFYKEPKGQNPIAVGIEGAYNNYLKGEPGVEIEQKITTGWKRTGQVVKESVEGADVVTSIDKEIQEVADSELERQLKIQQASFGCVIVMDVKTGFIRAISNLTRDQNGNYNEVYNHAIGRKEVPGSTFKLASLLAALEDDLIEMSDTVNAKGLYIFGKRDTLRDTRIGGYGKITLQTAFEKSSNVISKVIDQAYRRNPESFLDRLKQFGLTEPLGIELEGEAQPTVKKPGTKEWNGNTVAWMSVGYEFQQTPLQTLAFYNAVANQGKMVKPLFVKEIRRGSEVVKSFDPVVLRPKICADEHLRTMHECLKGVMKRGTGADLFSSQFEIAGKTGTSVILGSNNKYNKEKKAYQASFVGYFPADDPIYSCIVVISEPQKDVYGAKVSGTVFAAIANKVYASTLKYHRAINESKPRQLGAPLTKAGNRYDLQRSLKWLGAPFSMDGRHEWMYATRERNKVVLRRKKVTKNAIPNMTGMTAKDAVYLIESQGMVARIKGYGKVVKQSLPAGSPSFAGGIVTITLEP